MSTHNICFHGEIRTILWILPSLLSELWYVMVYVELFNLLFTGSKAVFNLLIASPTEFEIKTNKVCQADKKGVSAVRLIFHLPWHASMMRCCIRFHSFFKPRHKPTSVAQSDACPIGDQ